MFEASTRKATMNSVYIEYDQLYYSLPKQTLIMWTALKAMATNPLK